MVTLKAVAEAETVMEEEGAEASLANIIKDISDLNNTQNFKPGALEHIFAGEINNSGKAVGLHYDGFPTTKGNIIPGTETSPNSFGVFEAKVEVNGVAKVSNGGISSFFPKNWSAQKAVDTINEAFVNKVLMKGNTYIGTSSGGMQIMM